jgi:hypothetical protein
MSKRTSRRAVLAGAGGVTASLAGCLGFGSTEQIDVTVSNASETPLDYDVSIESFEGSGSVEPGGSDQYEDELSPPGSATQFDVFARFGQAVTASNESVNDSGAPEEAFLEIGAIDDTVDVNSNVIEISVTYSAERIIVNPVVENN